MLRSIKYLWAGMITNNYADFLYKLIHTCMHSQTRYIFKQKT